MGKVLTKHAGRRLFLKVSATGGLGALISRETTASSITDQCGFRLSAFESLSMLTDLLFRIQSDSFSLLNKRIENVVADCQVQLGKLCQTVEQLTGKLTTGENANRAQQMKVLAELGCATVTGLASGPNQQGATALLKSLETINREIAVAAEQLLPPGETMLGAEATALLRSIVVQVHRSAAIQRNLDEARKSLVTSEELIRSGTQNIQDILFTAGTWILVADSGNSAEARQARTTAVAWLEKAQRAMPDYIEKLKAEKLYLDNPAGYFFMLSLEGTREWVSNPERVAGLTNFRSTSESLHHAAAIGFNPARVTQLVHDHCPPDGVVRVGKLITVMTPVLLWKKAMQAKAVLGLGAPVTSEDVLRAVRAAMNLLGLWCAPFQNRVPNREQLAQSLASDIMSI